MARTLKICTVCHEFTFGQAETKGSLLIEIVLWLCLLVPGIVYSIWRLSGRKDVCDKCASPVIPADTPKGRALARQFHPD